MPQQRTLSEPEFNVIRDRLLSTAPDGLSESDFQLWVAPRLSFEIGKAESEPAKPEGSAVGRFVSNAAEMLNPIPAIKNLVTQPVETIGQNVGMAAVDQGRKAVDSARQGHYSEAAGHAGATVFPVLGPAAANAGEQIGSGDVAGGLGKSAGLLVPAAAPSLVRGAVNATRNMAPSGLRATIAETLESKGGAKVEDVISPKVGANKTRFGGMAKEVGPELAKNPGMAAWSREGLHGKVGAALEQATQNLDAVADSRLSARTFNTQPIIDALMERRKLLTAEAVEGTQSTRTAVSRQSSILDESGKPITVTDMKSAPIGKDVVPGPNAPRVAEIDKAIAEIKQLGPSARYEPLRRIRQAYDGPAKAIYSPSMTADYMKAQGGKLGAADVTGALREHLAKFDPDTAIANAPYSFFRKANDVLDATAEVERTRPKVGRRIIARLTGTILGEQVGGAGGAVAGYVLGPTVDAAASSGWTTQLQTAQLMTKLAKAIRAGDEGYVVSLAAQLKRFGKQTAVVGLRSTSPSGSQMQTTAPAR